jgi:sugar phosphate isomerase/epimerase
MTQGITYSVFTKPWPTLPLPQLGEFVQRLGFDGVELPLRPGYQVEPNHAQGLFRAARQLSEFDVKILSVAGPTDEATIAACAEAGVPTIRAMAKIGAEERYLEAEARLLREYDALVPLLDEYGVRLGLQNHCHRYVNQAIGLRRLVEKHAPQHIGVVWDAAHEALGGGPPDLALDAIWSHLCLVNLKNGFWRRTTGPEADCAQWSVYWTSGRHGLASWPRVAQELKSRDYDGVICLTAEYSARDAANHLIAEDLAFARSLFD